jgi:hypothetical protein
MEREKEIVLCTANDLLRIRAIHIIPDVRLRLRNRSCKKMIGLQLDSPMELNENNALKCKVFSCLKGRLRFLFRIPIRIRTARNFRIQSDPNRQHRKEDEEFFSPNFEVE